MSICQVSLNYMSSTQIASFFRSMRGFSISSTMETIAPDFPSQCPSDNVSIAGSLASEVTRNAANTMSTIAKMNQFRKRLSRTSMTTDVEAASINVPSRTDDSENKVYSESMPAMTTTNDTVSHGAVNQPFIVHKKRGVISEGECTSQLLN